MALAIFTNFLFAQDPIDPFDPNDLPGYDDGAINFIQSNPTYNGNCMDGSIDLIINGGIAPYTYIWSDGQYTQDLENLPDGYYCVTVTDDLCGTVSKCFDILCTPFEFDGDVINCIEGDDGSITLNIQDDGNQEYTYSWTSPEINFNSSEKDVFNLNEAEYCVVVTNSNGSSIEKCFKVVCCNQEVVTLEQVNTCEESSTGVLILEVQNASTDYIFNLYNAAGEAIEPTVINQNVFTFENLSKGVYNSTLSYKGVCVSEVPYEIKEIKIAGLNFNKWNDECNLYHKITYSNFENIGQNEVNLLATVIVDGNQTIIEDQNLSNFDNTLTIPCIGKNFVITLSLEINGNKCEFYKYKRWFETDIPLSSSISYNAECGILEVVNDPNSNWELVVTSMRAGGESVTFPYVLKNGEYKITYQYENKNCSSTSPYIVKSSYKKYITVSIISKNAPNLILEQGCVGACNSKLILTELTLGVSYFVYNGIEQIAWGTPSSVPFPNNDMVEDLTFENICPGFISVYSKVFDGQLWGDICLVGNFNIEVPIKNDNLQLQHTSAIQLDVTNCGGGGNPSFGAIDIDLTDESDCFSFLWSNGETTNEITGLDPGTYTVTITFEKDGEYGEHIESFEVLEEEGYVDPFEVQIISQQWSGGCNISIGELASIEATVIGFPIEGKEYSYNWSNGSETNSIDDQAGLWGAAPFFVTVTDLATSCEVIKEFTASCCYIYGNYGGGSALPTNFNIEKQNISHASNSTTADGFILIKAIPDYFNVNYVWRKNGQIISFERDLLNVLPGLYELTVFSPCAKKTKEFEVLACDADELQNLINLTILQYPCIVYDYPNEPEVPVKGRIRVDLTKYFEYYPHETVTRPPNKWTIDSPIFTVEDVGELFIIKYKIFCGGSHEFVTKRIELENEASDYSDLINNLDAPIPTCGYTYTCAGEEHESFESGEIYLLQPGDQDYDPNVICRARIKCPKVDFNGNVLLSNFYIDGEEQCNEIVTPSNGIYCVVACECVFDDVDVDDNTAGYWTKQLSDIDCEPLEDINNDNTTPSEYCEEYTFDVSYCETFYTCVDNFNDWYSDPPQYSKCSFPNGTTGTFRTAEYCECDILNWGDYLADLTVTSESEYGVCPQCIYDQLDNPEPNPFSDPDKNCNSKSSSIHFSFSSNEFVHYANAISQPTTSFSWGSTNKTEYEYDEYKIITIENEVIRRSQEISTGKVVYITESSENQYNVTLYEDSKKTWSHIVLSDIIPHIRIVEWAQNMYYIEVVKYINNTYILEKYRTDGYFIESIVISGNDNSIVLFDENTTSIGEFVRNVSTQTAFISYDNGDYIFNLPNTIDVKGYNILNNGNVIFYFDYESEFDFDNRTLAATSNNNAGYLILDPTGRLLSLRRFHVYENLSIYDIAFDNQDILSFSLSYANTEDLPHIVNAYDDPEYCPLALFINLKGVDDSFSDITLESLKRDNDKTEVTVFPNPFSSIFTVNPTCINRGETSLVDMKIYNTSGQEIILRDKLNCNVPQEFNLEEHPKGVYILEIIYDDNTTIRKKLIKV